MRISCPSCAAAYEVPDSALATGPRLLRCARCGHKFQAALPPAPLPAPAPAGPPPAAESIAMPEPPRQAPPEPPPRGAVPPPPPQVAPEARLGNAPASPGGDRFALAGWLLTVLALGGGAYAAFVFRAEIMQAWPPAERVFAALGLA
ncbi:zinc-ribbon domain-containing protein [Falsiroseomonas selenitidurans]|uniref:Zinc finger/thioredoxin putative domain-containing protein n=1 Tax=Falsiroseomonas selenitidurans TaxID=2716335 RepID=A0ABX1E3U3_9PROT|nr:zinc-ribbon domain-containing protein [Falsiroseomonas selenitidurans]NKC31438.1 hypothetical protein [Falsiroseomonas selenitidurans]